MHKFDASKFLDKIHKGISDSLLLAGEHTVSEIKKLTPVLTGNLINSTGREMPKNNKIRVFQNAEYALWVENRRLHFSYGIQMAIPTIKSLLRNIKT